MDLKEDCLVPLQPNAPSPPQPNPATLHTCSDADLDSAYGYDPQGRVQRIANATVTHTFQYDTFSRLNSESVTIDSLTRTTSYGYDASHRPTTVTYHGGEVVTTRYDSPGAAVGLSSSVHGKLVDEVRYDEPGRMPAAGNLWRTQRYDPWIASAARTVSTMTPTAT